MASQRSLAARQAELFSWDSPLTGELRGERSIMSYPFFSLEKTKDMTPIRYSFGDVSIEIGPGPKGVANIYDKELVLYIVSLLIERVRAGKAVDPEFAFTAHDFFRVTENDRPNKSAYDNLKDALDRLQGTQIKTNIETGGVGEDGAFSWLLSARTQYVRDAAGTKRLSAVKVRLCDWLYRAVLSDPGILAYSRAYFSLSPIERRLYEIAQTECFEGSAYEGTLDKLREQVGSKRDTRSFRRELRTIAERNGLPDYDIALADVISAEPRGTKGGRPPVETTVSLTPRPKRARLAAC